LTLRFVERWSALYWMECWEEGVVYGITISIGQHLAGVGGPVREAESEQ